MRITGKIILFFLSLFFLSAIHIGASYFLPFPWSKINLIFLLLVIIMMWRDTSLIVWVAFFTHLIIELYSATPFGVQLFSSTIGMLFTFWIYRNLFNNRSWYSAMAITAFSLTVYRLLYTASLILLKFLGIIVSIPWKNAAETFVWEILLTVFGTGITYFILSKFFKSFKDSPIEHGLFKV